MLILLATFGGNSTECRRKGADKPLYLYCELLPGLLLYIVADSGESPYFYTTRLGQSNRDTVCRGVTTAITRKSGAPPPFWLRCTMPRSMGAVLAAGAGRHCGRCIRLLLREHASGASLADWIQASFHPAKQEYQRVDHDEIDYRRSDKDLVNRK